MGKIHLFQFQYHQMLRIIYPLLYVIMNFYVLCFTFFSQIDIYHHFLLIPLIIQRLSRRAISLSFIDIINSVRQLMQTSR